VWCGVVWCGIGAAVAVFIITVIKYVVLFYKDRGKLAVQPLL
jgi:hypothetical protein